MKRLLVLANLFDKKAQRKIVQPKWQTQESAPTTKPAPSKQQERGSYPALMDLTNFSVSEPGIAPQAIYENQNTQGTGMIPAPPSVPSAAAPVQRAESVPEAVTELSPYDKWRASNKIDLSQHGPFVMNTQQAWHDDLQAKIEKHKKERAELEKSRRTPQLKFWNGSEYVLQDASDIVSKEEKAKEKEKLKSKQELAEEYWADKVEKVDYKNPEISAKNQEEWRNRLDSTDEEKKKAKQPAVTQDEAFEQAKARIDEIDAEIKSLTEIVQDSALSKVMNKDEAAAYSKKARQENKGGTMKEVHFPKTPYSEPFIKWIFVKNNATNIEEALVGIYKLKMNYNDIIMSLKNKEDRESYSGRNKRIEDYIKTLEDFSRSQSRAHGEPEEPYFEGSGRIEKMKKEIEDKKRAERRELQRQRLETIERNKEREEREKGFQSLNAINRFSIFK